MPTPTILVPREKSKHRKNDEGCVSNTDPDTTTVVMDVPESQEQTQNQEDSEQNKENTNQDYIVYQYLGQNIHPKDFTVQFFGISGQPEQTGGGFNYDPSRNLFVRLVLAIVMIMLMCTAGFVMAVAFVEPVTDMFLSPIGFWLFILATIMMIALSYVISCSECGRVPPCSHICLILAVVGMSIIAGYIAVKVRPILILYALIATVITVFICVLIACSSFDFTKFYIYIIVAFAVVSVLGTIIVLGMVIANVYIKPLHIGILILGTLFGSIVLIMQLQMVIGGKTIELNEDDYALASFMIYTSILDIFIRFLMLLNLFDS